MSSSKALLSCLKVRQSNHRYPVENVPGGLTVDPEGADVFPEHKRKWNSQRTMSTRQLRYTEYYLMPHEFITVIGLFRTEHAIDTWNDAEELRLLLAEWKRDQSTLLRRFDTNSDGVLDAEEWEKAREEARKQLSKEKLRHSVNPGFSIIGAPDDRRPFLIAPHANDDFAGKLRRKALMSFSKSEQRNNQ